MLFLRLFGVGCGLLCIAASIFAFDGALAGPVCRINCGLHVAIIQFLGQSAYNAVVGTLGMAAGGSLVFASLTLERQHRRGKQTKRRSRQ